MTLLFDDDAAHTHTDGPKVRQQQQLKDWKTVLFFMFALHFEFERGEGGGGGGRVNRDSPFRPPNENSLLLWFPFSLKFDWEIQRRQLDPFKSIPILNSIYYCSDLSSIGACHWITDGQKVYTRILLKSKNKNGYNSISLLINILSAAVLQHASGPMCELRAPTKNIEVGGGHVIIILPVNYYPPPPKKNMSVC